MGCCAEPTNGLDGPSSASHAMRVGDKHAPTIHKGSLRRAFLVLGSSRRHREAKAARRASVLPPPTHKERPNPKRSATALQPASAGFLLGANLSGKRVGPIGEMTFSPTEGARLPGLPRRSCARRSALLILAIYIRVVMTL
jgi:hypothetical protein